MIVLKRNNLERTIMKSNENWKKDNSGKEQSEKDTSGKE